MGDPQPSRPDADRSERLRTLLVALAVLIAVVAYLWMRHGGFTPLLKALAVGATPLHDFRGFFYPMGERFFAEQRPIPGFFYSPTAALGFAVLALLPYDAAAWVWGAILIAASLGLAWAARWVLPKGWWVGFACTLAAYPMLHGLRFGQVSVLLSLCAVGAWYAYEKGWVRRSALLLAAAITIKYYFAVFLLFYAARRDTRALAWCVGFCAVGLVLLPVLAIGPLDTWHFYAEIARSLQESFGAHIGDPNSQSLASVVGRLSKANGLPSLIAVEPWVRLGVAGGLAVWAWRLASDPTDGARAQAFVVIFCATPFLVATSWPHYFVYVPWSCCVVWRQLAVARDAGRPGVLWWAGHVAVAAGAVMLSMPFFDSIGDRHAFVRAGYPLAANIAVLVGLGAARIATAPTRPEHLDGNRASG